MLRHISFKNFKKLAKQNNMIFIIDEVQTGGGATGKWWAYEHFNLPESPDIVCFSKKLQSAGFYFKKELFPSHPYRIFNTWMGSVPTTLQTKKIIEVVKRDNLLESVQETGEKLLKGLLKLSKVDQRISNIRGLGTFSAFDCVDPQFRESLIKKLRNNGISIGPCGFNSVRIRPTLTFSSKHAEVFLGILEKTLTQLK